MISVRSGAYGKTSQASFPVPKFELFAFLTHELLDELILPRHAVSVGNVGEKWFGLPSLA